MRVFISYSRGDRDPARAQFVHGDVKIVNKLLKFLTDAGYDVWIDSAALKGAQNWEQEIHRAIRSSNVVICLGSPNWRTSEYCSKELDLALRFGKPVLPVLLAPDDQLPSVFQVQQYVDFTRGINLSALGKFVAGLRHVEAEVLDIVQNILGRPFEWVEIPLGQVALQDFSRRNIADFPCNGPVGSTAMVNPFAIAKYPITVEQFALFAEREDGYSDPRWWDFSRRAMDWRQGDGAELQPNAYPGERLPRTSVSWYDAAAFCRWLSSISGEQVRLPTESEWQWAAQGGDGRLYPWGLHFEPDRCNYVEIGPYSDVEYQPTPVDAYPRGASPFGVMDMSGNVWEWTLTGLKCGLPTLMDSAETNALEADVSRILKGGSGKRGIGEQERLMVTYRGEVDRPSRRSRSRGFRIVRASV